MHKGNWEIISKQIEEADKEIFKGIDKSTLSDYEKRKMIFSYMCNNLEYDNTRLLDIILCSAGIYVGLKLKKISKYQAKEMVLNEMMKSGSYDKEIFDTIAYRIDNDLLEPNDGTKDLENVMKTKKCLCHSASQFYKLLLEYNGIYAVSVYCDNGMPVPHQISLVYDKEHDSYSFDDISTFTAAKKYGEKDMYKYFDYDYEDAKKICQGTKQFDKDGTYWELSSSIFTNINAGKDDDWYLQFGLEANNNLNLPKNLQSLKKNEQIKR